MSGGKGGSTTSSVTVPEYIEKAAQRNLNKAERISQIGYTPYFGPDVAGFTPMQQSGFQNTADVAGAFGMAAPVTQQDIMGGMDAPETYAGGVSGYSSAPMYQQSIDELAAQRPGQQSYIDSFFIDPYSGEYANQPTDYTEYGTIADQTTAQQANDLAIAQAQAGAGPQNVNYNLSSMAANPNLSTQPNAEIFDETPSNIQNSQQILGTDPLNPNYNNAFEDVYNYQSEQAVIDPYGQSTGFGITPEIIEATGGASAWVPGANDQASSLITNPAEGIEDTSMASAGTQFANDIGESFTGILSNTIPGQILMDDTYNVGGVNNPIQTPTLAEMIQNAPDGMQYDPASGSYTAVTPSVANAGVDIVPVSNDGEGPGILSQDIAGVITSPRPPVRDSDNRSGDEPDATVLCTAYFNMGYLPRDIFELDGLYGISLYQTEPKLVVGYRICATRAANFIQTDSISAKVVRAALWPFVKSWAEQMAHEMKPNEYDGNFAGKAIMSIGIPFGRFMASLFLNKPATKEAF
jgi:hypothetical protein